MIHIRSAGEIQKISKACQIVKETLELVEQIITPGITALELDTIAENFIRSKLEIECNHEIRTLKKL